MNFRTLLNDFAPFETGDFFRLYRINDRSFVIYSSEEGVISCMELYGFTNISVGMLSEIIDYSGNQEEKEEFVFASKCSRQQLINYLFDISSKETNVKLKHVSGLHGYLLKSVQQDKTNKEAYRNLFQFDPARRFEKLLFDDSVSLASIRTDKSGPVYVCWSPVLFFGLDKSGDPDSVGYLLASSSPILMEYVLSKTAADRKLHILVGEYYLNALLFLSAYVSNYDLSYKLLIHTDVSFITVQFYDWPTPQKILNFISSVNKQLPDGYEKLSCVIINKKTFLYVPRLHSYVRTFLVQYAKLIDNKLIDVSITS